MADEKPTQKDPAIEIRSAALKSGKPLEVVCARSFMNTPPSMAEGTGENTGWKVYLGSYYEDGLSEKVRELDVLARRQRIVPQSHIGFNCMLEAFVSCKGFPEDEFPVTFSVAGGIQQEHEKPILLTEISTPGKNSILGAGAVQMLLYFLNNMDPVKTAGMRRTIGFDVVKDPRDPKREWQAKGDRTIFEGLDSALRATLYWRRKKLPPFFSHGEGLVRVQLPILVLSRPWHEISIDGETPGDLVPTSLGFTSNLYPVMSGEAPPLPLFTLLMSRERLPELQKALTNLYGWLWTQGTQAFQSPQ